MSLNQVSNVVLLFSSSTWSDSQQVTSQITSNLTESHGDLVYSERLSGGLTTTLSRTGSPTTDDTVQGLLYVPELGDSDPCQEKVAPYMPKNVTRRSDLPTTSYNMIAIIPWVENLCTFSFFHQARNDPLRAMLVFLPDNDTLTPPPADHEIWNLGDNGGWKEENRFPVFAIPGAYGASMMQQLGQYSGDVSQAPFSDNISAIYHPGPEDYIRVWSELDVRITKTPIQLWSLVLAIAGVLIIVIGGISLFLHFLRKRRRVDLRRRVEEGEVELETLGIKRLRVPIHHIRNFPLFTYNYEQVNQSSTTSEINPGSEHSRNTTVEPDKDEPMLFHQPVCQVCFEDFESGVTIIRELPCGHIFHPDCIDEFLSQASSLCPVCKASMLPAGHCPRITNEMVRRERAIRRLRPTIEPEKAAESQSTRLGSWASSLKKHVGRLPSRKSVTEDLELGARAHVAKAVSPSMPQEHIEATTKQ